MQVNGPFWEDYGAKGDKKPKKSTDEIITEYNMKRPCRKGGFK